MICVTIFDRRSIGPDTIHLYYTSFYLQSRRFHTKHVLIYSCIEEEKGKDNKVGAKCNVMYKVRTKYKDKVRKDHAYSMRLTGSVTPPDGNWTLSRASVTSREKKNSENTLKRRKTEKYNKEMHVNEQLLGCRWKRVVVETNHQAGEGEHFHCCLLIVAWGDDKSQEDHTSTRNYGCWYHL